MHEEQTHWTPKVGDEVVYQPPYKRRGLIASPRRGLIVGILADEKFKIRISMGVYLEVSPIHLRLVK